jgi:type I restriction enzyme S subunit
MEWKTEELSTHIKFVDYRGKTPTKVESGMRLITAKNVKMGFIQVNPQEYVDPEIYDEWMTRGIPKKGDVLFTTEAPLGNVAQLDVEERVVIGQRLITMQPDQAVIDSTFLKYSILSPQFQAEIESRATGATVLGIKAKLLKQVPLTYPPILEQKRIVALLDTVFADLEQTRAKTEQNLKNARELFDSYLQQVFSQKGEGWEELTLENLVSEDCSLSYGIVQPGDDFNDGLPVVRPTDLKAELITPDGLKLIDPVKSESYKRTVLQGGELLVCVRGSTGITSIACNSLAGANVTRGIVPVRFNPELISGRFGYYQFISPLVQSQIKDATYGAALMQINIRDFRKIKISTPSIEVQKSLVNKLDSIRPDLIRAEEIYKQKTLALDELKKSILQKVFSGELNTTAK